MISRWDARVIEYAQKGILLTKTVIGCDKCENSDLLLLFRYTYKVEESSFVININKCPLCGHTQIDVFVSNEIDLNSKNDEIIKEQIQVAINKILIIQDILL